MCSANAVSLNTLSATIIDWYVTNVYVSCNHGTLRSEFKSLYKNGTRPTHVHRMYYVA